MGKPLQWDWRQALAAVGKCLDEQAPLRVLNGGVVVPSTPSATSTLGLETIDVSAKGTRRSTTGPRQRAPRWQGSSGRAWTAGNTAPVVSRLFQKQYEAELSGIGEFYPGTRLWHQAGGIWLLCKSNVLDGLHQHAIFLTGISYAWPAMVRSWGFWAHELATPSWIGPRHTNFYDGSICAFEPTDGTWVLGQPIVRLLDLYTVWALRHLHLEFLGRWPGEHVAHYAIERLWEQRDNEYCGCGATSSSYRDCCKPKDSSETQVGDAVQFAWFPRKPPPCVLAVLYEGANPPELSDF